MDAFRPVFVIGSLIAICLISFGSLATSESAAEKLVIGLTVPEGSPDEKFQRLFISEAYRRVKIEVEIKHYPMKRTSIMANNGLLDGEAERVGDYSERFTNLIRVEESPRSLKFVANAANPAITLEKEEEGWEALRNTSYLVDYHRGVKKAEEKLTELVSSENLSKIDRVEQGIKRLKSGRTDILITSDYWLKKA